MTALAYWQAFQAVKKSLTKVLNENSAGVVVSRDHSIWYRELFAPSANGGLLSASDLAGYRNQPVYIRKSMHVPTRYESMRDLMPAFCTLLKDEEEPAVWAVLSHFFFAYIHPYTDGNGRMGRFLMNAYSTPKDARVSHGTIRIPRCVPDMSPPYTREQFLVWV